MDVINKFYTSVSSTVSQFSSVLSGNPVTREYEIQNQIATAGNGLSWKVFNGQKKSTKQKVSVFFFEKKQLERWSKEDRDCFVDNLKNGIHQLTKIRHPNVLTIEHPLEESRDSFAFAAEPTFISLSNILHKNQFPSRLEIVNFSLHEIEIKHGILELVKGLNFLHTDMKLIHRNITPESIIINQQGNWKIFGFDFCIFGEANTRKDTLYNTSFHTLNQPPLEYTAPEIALNNEVVPESDLFSLGVLIYSIYNEGKPIKIFSKNYDLFKKFAIELSQSRFHINTSYIPPDLTTVLKILLHASPTHRPKLHQISKASYFDDIAVKTLNFLDSPYQLDNLQRSKFYKDLIVIIPTFPHRINLQHILPHLVKEFVNPQMIPFVLPNLLIIAENSSQKEYNDFIVSHLKIAMKLQEPIQILLLLMSKINLLLKLTQPDDVKLHVLPMLYKALECNVVEVQELALSVLPTCSSLIDYHATKNAVIPRIKNICLNSKHLSVQVNCLICLGKLLLDLDKWLVLDEILPFLNQIQNRDPAIIMAITGIYKIAFNDIKLGISKDVIATKIIPFLMPLSIENRLTTNQFLIIINLIKEMVQKIENEQRLNLEQISTIQKEPGTNLINNELQSISLNCVQSKTIGKNDLLLPSVPTESLEKPKVNAFTKTDISWKPTSSFYVEEKTSDNMINTNYLNFASNLNIPNNGVTNNHKSLDVLDFFEGKKENHIPINQMIASKNNTVFMSQSILNSESQSSNDNGLKSLSQQDILDFLN